MPSNVPADGVPYERAGSSFLTGNSEIFGDLDEEPPQRWRKPLSAGDAMEDDGGFMFITANDPSGFKKKKMMTTVRKKAMVGYLRSESEKQTKSSPKDQKTSGYQESHNDVEAIVVNEEPLRIFRGESRRHSAASNVKVTSEKAATWKPTIQATKSGVSSRLNKAQERAPDITTPMEALSGSGTEAMTHMHEKFGVDLLERWRRRIDAAARAREDADPSSGYEEVHPSSDEEFTQSSDKLEVSNLSIDEGQVTGPETGATSHWNSTSRSDTDESAASPEGEKERPHKKKGIVQALYNYRQRTPKSEVTLAVGDVIEVHRKDPSGWWFGRNITSSQEGWFPANHVKEGGDANIVERYMAGQKGISLHDAFHAAQEVEIKAAVSFLKYVEDKLHRVHFRICSQPDNYQLSRSEYDLLQLVPDRYSTDEAVLRALHHYSQTPQSEDNPHGKKKGLLQPSMPAQSTDSEAEDDKFVSSVSLTESLDTESTVSELSVATLKGGSDVRNVSTAAQNADNNVEDFSPKLDQPQMQEQFFDEVISNASDTPTKQQPGVWDTSFMELYKIPQEGISHSYLQNSKDSSASKNSSERLQELNSVDQLQESAAYPEYDESRATSIDQDPNVFSLDYQFSIAIPEKEVYGKAVALFDFERENENELGLVEGQIVMVSYQHGQGWLMAQDPKTGESGLVPEDYVRLLRDIDAGWKFPSESSQTSKVKDKMDSISTRKPRSPQSSSAPLPPSGAMPNDDQEKTSFPAEETIYDLDLASGATWSKLKVFGREAPLPLTESRDKPSAIDQHDARNLSTQLEWPSGLPPDIGLTPQPDMPPRKEWSSKSYRSLTSATTSIGSDTDDTDILDFLEENKERLKARKLWRRPDADYSVQLPALEEESDDDMVEKRLQERHVTDPKTAAVLDENLGPNDDEYHDPHMTFEEVDLSIDTWKDIRDLLPEEWRWDVDFHTAHSNTGGDHGCWTYTPTDMEPRNFPLSIAGAPVVIPVDYRWPPVAGLNPPPDPRPSNPIDSTAEVPLDIVRDIFLTFEGSIGFYLLVSGILQVMVPGDFDTAWASSHLPHKYGGLRVSYITQSMDPTMFPSKTETMRSRGSQSTESSQISSISSLLSQFRPSGTSLSHPLQLNDFIEARSKTSHRKDKFAGRIGLKVNKGADEYLVMPTHVITEAILAKSARSSLFGRKRAPNEQLEGDWNEQVELWAGNERIGNIERTFDAEAEIYPDGFRHDVTLIKPANPASVRAIQSPVPELGWLSRESWSGLRQQPNGLKLLGETESHRKAKSLKTSRPAEVLIVGEGIFLNQSALPRPTREHDMSVWRDLVSRCVLYRVYPDFDPPTGHSGTALYAEGMREDGTMGPGVVGFQSFVQRSGHVQSFEMEGSALEKRLKLGRVAFYGAFQVPEELRRDFRIA